jgi:hypothetical protein
MLLDFGLGFLRCCSFGAGGSHPFLIESRGFLLLLLVKIFDLLDWEGTTYLVLQTDQVVWIAFAKKLLVFEENTSLVVRCVVKNVLH